MLIPSIYYLQRQTERLAEKKIKQEIQLFLSLAHQMKSKSFDSALETISKLKKTSKNKYISIEYRLQQCLCYFAKNNQNQALQLLQTIHKESDQLLNQKIQQQDKQNIQKILIRIYTICLVLIVKGSKCNLKNIDDKDILEKLGNLLKKHPNKYKQTMKKLTGTYDIFQMLKPISTNEKDIFKRAIKLDILAVWRYILGCKQQAIKNKTQALKCWKKGSQEKFIECQSELAAMKGQKQSCYINKLNNLRIIIKYLKSIKPTIPKNLKQITIKIQSFRKSFSNFLQQISSIEENILINQHLKNSTLSKINQNKSNKQQNTIQEYRRIGVNFYDQEIENCSDNFMDEGQNQKFINELLMEYRKNQNKQSNLQSKKSQINHQINSNKAVIKNNLQ